MTRRNMNTTANTTTNTNKGEKAMTKTINLTLPTMNNGDQLIMTFVDGMPCFKNMNGEVVNVNIFNTVEVNVGETLQEQGYVKDKLKVKRWIMAQMFEADNYKGKSGSGYDCYYREREKYGYQWETICDLMDKQAKLAKERRFEELYIERYFFNMDNVKEMLDEMFDTIIYPAYKDYATGKVDFMYRLEFRSNGYYEYTSRRWVDKSEVANKLVEIRAKINEVESIKDADKFAKELRNLIERYIPERMDVLKSWTAKSKIWLDAFKKRGAYFTLENMMIGGWRCKLTNEYTGELLAGEEAMVYLDELIKFKKGYEMMGILRNCIDWNETFNNFDFYRKMRIKYSNR